MPHDKPSFPFGTHPFLSEERHLAEYIHEDYHKFKMEQNQKVHGWFLFGKPALNINDVELLKQIQVKDFDHFVDRNESNTSRALGTGGKLDRVGRISDPCQLIFFFQLWGIQMANAVGEQWKDIRSTFTPIFTSGKMKAMLRFLLETTQALTGEFQRKANAGEEFELKETFGKFSLDALASCAFAMDAQSFEDKNSVFVKHSARIFLNTRMDNFLMFLRFMPGVPKLQELLNINTFKPKPTKFLSDVVSRALQVRRESGERRNDMIDLMLDCIKEGEREGGGENETDEIDQIESDMKLQHERKHASRITEDEIIATAMVFLVAGYDTTGMTLAYLAYEMSINPELQERLHQEVDQAFEDNDGEMPDYQTIQNLPYIDMLIHETLRFHTPVGFNTRNCTEDYTLPGTSVSLKKNDLVTYSISGIHMDPTHYSHPDQFYPEHFSKEEKARRHP